jgi:hypothetical protein
MKTLWCWRCKTDVTMLDDDEFKRVFSLFNTEGHSQDQVFGRARDEYERITGVRETNPNAIHHHRLSLYGLPCANCRKPLRTPRANLCGFCMKSVQ